MSHLVIAILAENGYAPSLRLVSKDVRSLVTLTELTLDFDKLPADIDVTSLIRKCKKLRIKNITDAQLRKIEWSQFTSLTKLDISCTNVAEMYIIFQRIISQLTELHINNIKIKPLTVCDLSPLAKCPALTTMDFYV